MTGIPTYPAQANTRHNARAQVVAQTALVKHQAVQVTLCPYSVAALRGYWIGSSHRVRLTHTGRGACRCWRLVSSRFAPPPEEQRARLTSRTAACSSGSGDAAGWCSGAHALRQLRSALAVLKKGGTMLCHCPSLGSAAAPRCESGAEYMCTSPVFQGQTQPDGSSKV